MTDVNAGGVGSGGQERGASASPKEMISDAAQTVKQEAASFASDAKEKAADQLGQHKQAATETLSDFANAIRKAGDELSQGDQSVAGRVVRQAADGLEGFARSVADKRPEELLDAVREFGRRNPTAFIAGSVLAGVALGRFLKSSGDQASQSGSAGAFGSGETADLMSSDYGSGANLPDEVTASGATSIGAPAHDTQPPPMDDIAASDATDPLERPRFGSEL
jgi:hypothetical protein